jgi:hypothetical protein
MNAIQYDVLKIRLFPLFMKTDIRATRLETFDRVDTAKAVAFGGKPDFELDSKFYLPYSKLSRNRFKTTFGNIIIWREIGACR